MGREIAISKFKAECLNILQEAADTGEEIVVTKRGKPLVRVVPVEDPPTLQGSVTYLVSDDELVAPIDAEWSAERS